jgi:hypothetical protein
MNMRMLSVTSIVAGITMGVLMGCGAVGAPIPPENVGVNLTIERQKKLELLEEKQREGAGGSRADRATTGLNTRGTGCQSPSVTTGGYAVMFRRTVVGPVRRITLYCTI